MNSESKQTEDCSKASTCGEMKAISPSSNDITTMLKKSGKGRSAAHGVSYPLRLAVIIILRNLKHQRQKGKLEFKLALEVAAAGKFDDIMYFFSSALLSSSTLFIQAKHKQKAGYNEKLPKKGKSKSVNIERRTPVKGSMIPLSALFATWDSNATYSIPMYFISFLEVNQNLSRLSNARYVLCTNAALDKSIESFFIKSDKNPVPFILRQFCDDIEATCYQFDPHNPFPDLFDTLRDACLEKLGKMIAWHIVKEKPIMFDNELFTLFSCLIKECLLPFGEDTGDSSEVSYTIKEQNMNEDDSTPTRKLKIAIKMEHNTILEKGSSSTGQSVIKINRSTFTAALSAADPEWSAKFESKVLEFYDKFVLVCNSLNEESLRRKAKTLLPEWCNAKPEAVLDKLEGICFNAMKQSKPIPIELKHLQETFLEIELNPSIALLKYNSEEYLKSLIEMHPIIEVDLQHLEHSALSGFIAHKDAEELYEFDCSFDRDVSALVIGQTLKSQNLTTINLNSDWYGGKEQMLESLTEVLAYLHDVDHPTIKVVTILANPQHEAKDEIVSLSARFKKKLILVQQTLGQKCKSTKDCITVDMLKTKNQEQLLSKKMVLHGIVIPLNRILFKKDNVCVMLSALELRKHANGLDSNCSNSKNFNKINHWYIQRDYVLYDSETEGPDFKFTEKSYYLMQLAREWYHWTNVSFEKMADLFNTRRPTALAIVSAALSRSNEDRAPPGLLEHGGNQGKVFIFLDDAGVGKTSYFTWLARRLSIYDRSWYVVKLLALEYSIDFGRLQDEEINQWNDTQLVQLLYRLTHLALFVPSSCKRTVDQTDIHRAEADRCAKAISLSNGRIVLKDIQTKEQTAQQLIELRWFMEKYNQQQLVLILDGFDEIDSDFSDVVMKCFSKFSHLEGIRYLYLSSRPYGLTQALEKTFSNCVFYRLKPFTEEDRIYAFHNFLRSKIDAYKRCRSEELAPVLGIFYTLVCCGSHRLRTVPLMLHLMFVRFLPNVQNFVCFESRQICGKIFEESKFDLFEMVEMYIHRKLRIHNVEKTGSIDSASARVGAQEIERELALKVKEEHGLLGAYALFPKACRHELFSEQDAKFVIENLKKILRGEDGTGIISGVLDGMPIFVHRTFAEYLAAFWLSRNHRRVLGRVRFFRSITFWSGSYGTLSHFFELLIVKQCDDCPIHEAMVTNSQQSVEELLSNNVSALYKKDSVGRTPFHLLAGYYSYNTVNSLIERALLVRDTVSLRDELLQWTVLEHAFACSNIRYVKDLLQFDPPVSLDVLLEQLFTSDIDLLIKQAIKYEELLFTHKATRDLAKQIGTRVVKHILNERQLSLNARIDKLDYSTILEYCIQLDAYDMFLLFLSHTDNPYQVLYTDIDQLFQTAFSRKRCRFVLYFIEYYNFTPPKVNQFYDFADIMCDIKCVEELTDEEMTDEQLPQHPENEKFDHWIEQTNCCVRSNRNVRIALPEYQNGQPFQYKSIIECLLVLLVMKGSTAKISYVLRVTGRVVTNELIVKIMRLLPKTGSHKDLRGSFLYLLKRTTNLDQVDNVGRNLLHMTVQNGCSYMLHCLLSMGFDASQVNERNGWNVFHYIASRVSDTVSLSFLNDSNVMFEHFLQVVQNPNYLFALDINGYRVLDVAIIAKSFAVARTIINLQIGHVRGAEERLFALLEIVKYNMIEKCRSNVEKLFVYLSESTDDNDWKMVYETAVKQLQEAD